eukprot:1160393-Pelagomonas_calceolata.AAC.8
MLLVKESGMCSGRQSKLGNLCMLVRSCERGSRSRSGGLSECLLRGPAGQKEVFLNRLYAEDPDVHAMLRRPKHTHCTPLSHAVWAFYLSSHFCPRAAAQVLVRVLVCLQGTAMPLGRNHDTEALLRHGDQNNWMPVPDGVASPTLAAMQQLVAEQIGKTNGHASPGFDCVAAPFIKYATVFCPRMSGWGTERVNVLEPFIGQLFKLLNDKACIPEC